jgi:hypothetical protein
VKCGISATSADAISVPIDGFMVSRRMQVTAVCAKDLVCNCTWVFKFEDVFDWNIRIGLGEVCVLEGPASNPVCTNCRTCGLNFVVPFDFFSSVIIIN